MSGPIRQTIGLAKARLVKNINEAGEQIDKFNRKEKINLDFTSLINNKIIKTINQLETANIQWSDLLKGASDDTEFKKLEAEYNKYTNENNFLEIIQEGYEASANLESIISKFEKLKTNDHVNVKLPQLTLPEFDGTTTQWPSFWASFTSSIDETNLPIIQKFIYLRNCLKGKAFKEIEGYHLIEDNYQLAIKHLKERFGDDNSIILSLYSELRKLPSAGKTVPSIRQTFIELDIY